MILTESLNKTVPFQLGGDNSTTFHVNFQLTEEELTQTMNYKTFFQVRKLIVPNHEITAVCLQVLVESVGEDLEETSLQVSVGEGEGRAWSLTVPGEVTRGGRAVCRTNQPFLHLNTRDVMDPHSSCLNLTLATDAKAVPVQHFKLTVSLESNQFQWEAVETTR